MQSHAFSKMNEYLKVLRLKMDSKYYMKLQAIKVPSVHQFIAEAAELCNPEKIFVADDSPEDIAYIKRMALETGEEKPLAIPEHTVHFDGPYDQGRDREATKYLVPKGEYLSKALNQIDRDEGLAEELFTILNQQRERLLKAREKFGTDYVPPE
jgi:phosphoenolpyruvate carboxykinase (GTP)